LIREAWLERKGVRFGEKIHQPAATKLMHETAKFLGYVVGLAETTRARSWQMR